jgi:glycosyltransferase involved in cell wall biosynthesis
MKLVASMITKNELSRYLPLVIEHLQDFCDEIRVLDDYSTDATVDALEEWDLCEVRRNRGQTFDEHEGAARNELLRWTLLGKPTHILAIDADEFISDGQELRRQIEAQGQQAVFGITMQEIWEARQKGLSVRADGGWREHPIPILYRAPSQIDRRWQVAMKKLACGREPLAVRQLARHQSSTGVDILHFGWTRKSERQRRYDRYMSIDGGRFHNNQHLQSIMWPAAKVILRERSWPEALQPLKERLLAVTSAR